MPRSEASAERRLIDALTAIVGDPECVVTGPSALLAYDSDAYPVERRAPLAAVLPKDTEQVQEVIRWCLANDMPFTPRGAGTGLSGGATPLRGGVVISTKKLDRILEIDVPNRQLLAQAGVVSLRLSEAVAQYGLHFAPDPSSQMVATLGGGIAENSGGAHCLKYGVTLPHVLSVKMVTCSGDVVTFGSRLPEGPGYDLVGQVVGSEGTLGIVTEAWVKLTPLPAAVKTALASFADVRQATEAVAAVLASGIVPAALEFMDRRILDALHAAFGLEFPDGTLALLLIECDGEPEDVEREAAQVERCMLEHGAIEARVARDEAERTKLWTARKKGVGALGRIAPSKVTHDAVIPRSKLPEVLAFVYEVADRHGLWVGNMFHAGDGNLHPMMCYDPAVEGQVKAVMEAGAEIARKCIELGGSITGEHGVGAEKRDLMPLMYGPEDLRLQRDVRAIFEPSELCNPGKVLP